jgi:intracellular septation protein A
VNTAPAKDPPPRRGRAMLTLLFDMGAPIVMFYILTAAGLSSFTSLLLSAVLPGLSTVYQVIRSRHLDALAVFMMAITVITALASLISGSPRFLLAKDGWVTGISGAWLLATTRANPPVVFMFARPLLEGRIGPNGESWTVLWNRLPAFRHIWRVASIVWGVATILDAIVRFVMAYTLPVEAVPALNGAQYAVLFVLLQIVTNTYYYRAGLYDSQSALYAPIRPTQQATTEHEPSASSPSTIYMALWQVPA